MRELSPDIGRVVYSKAGRDAGGYYIIVRLDESPYVYVADGRLRSVSKPKRKKLRHLALKPAIAQAIAETIAGGGMPLDADIRKALKQMGYGEV